MIHGQLSVKFHRISMDVLEYGEVFSLIPAHTSSVCDFYLLLIIILSTERLHQQALVIYPQVIPG